MKEVETVIVEIMVSLELDGVPVITTQMEHLSHIHPEIHLRRHLRRVQEQVLQILIQRVPLIQKEILRL